MTKAKDDLAPQMLTPLASGQTPAARETTRDTDEHTRKANVPPGTNMAETVERVLIQGDLSRLSVDERNFYYQKVCASVRLNPLTRPFEYLTLNGKLQLYARKDATDQLRSLHKISVVEVTTAAFGDVYVVTTKVTNAQGRTDMATGAVSLGKASGEFLANLMMKAETKSKRRATLSICGLGLLDETETENIEDKSSRRQISEPEPPPHDATTGEIMDDAIPEWGDGPRDHPTPNDPAFGSDPSSEPVSGADRGTAGVEPRTLTSAGTTPAEPPAARLAQFTKELEVAAESGSEALRRAWLLIPPGDRTGVALEALLRRCQKRAEEIDEAARLM